MTQGLAIRDAGPEDAAAIGHLYAAAFPQEDLQPLVRRLAEPESEAFCLVAERGGEILGHAAFTRCRVEGGHDGELALLGPVAVLPAAQRRGIGSALIHAGLGRLAEAGTRQLQVLGDPAYYGRLGFARDTEVEPPFPIPAPWRPAWQSRRLRPGAPLRGRLLVPAPWRQRALWAP